ncbi:MAG: transporter substrate-binding domain-containing protein [Actinomycetes bacterium]
MNKLRAVALAFVAGTTALSLSACATSGTPSASAPASGSASYTLVDSSKLTVCTHLAYKPFQFKDASGAIIGFDVDLMDLVAKDLGVTQEIIDIEFNQITSGSVFAAKKCDVGAAAITITDARRQSATFSDGYFKATQALLVQDSSGITGLENLQGKTLAVQTDTTGKDYAEKNAAQYGYEVRIFDDMPTGANAVLGGSVDAAINDNGVLFDFAKDNPSVEVVTEFQTGEEYGFNVGNDNAALAEKINEVLDAAEADGTYNEIYKKWFGVDAPA